MKMRLTFGIVWAALAGTLTFVAASSIQRNVAPQGIQAAQASEAMQARAQAQDEAEDVVPATVTHYAPYYLRGPRIIHVPQSGDERASVNTRNEPEYTDEDDNEAAPQPRRRGAPRTAPRTTPRWGMHNEKAPLPTEPRRAVLTPPLAAGPTPVKPTPRFGPKAAVKTDAGEKFGPPRPISSSPPPPPISYKPPDARPSGL